MVMTVRFQTILVAPKTSLQTMMIIMQVATQNRPALHVGAWRAWLYRIAESWETWLLMAHPSNLGLPIHTCYTNCNNDNCETLRPVAAACTKVLLKLSSADITRFLMRMTRQKPNRAMLQLRGLKDLGRAKKQNSTTTRRSCTVYTNYCNF